MTIENIKSKMKMIPTNGKRPKGLENGQLVWVQGTDGTIDIRIAGVLFWEKWVAYHPAEQPEPYVPEPDYSKWVGCLVKDLKTGEIVGPVLHYVANGRPPSFVLKGMSVPTRELELVPPDEIREYLKKAEEASK